MEQNVSYGTKQLKELQMIVRKESLGAFLCTSPSTLRYLVDLPVPPSGRKAFLVVEPRQATIFVSQVHEAEVRRLPMVRAGVAAVNVDMRHEGMLALISRHLSRTKTCFIEEKDLLLSEYDAFKERLTEKDLQKGSSFIEDIRMTKTKGERLRLRKAASIADKVFIDVVLLLKNENYRKYTEMDIAERISSIGKTYGAEGTSFPAIVACGAGSAEPHYEPKVKKLKEHTSLLLDFGFTYKGYHSDMSRTLFLGMPTKKMRHIYELVLKNNIERIAECKEGTPLKTLAENAVGLFDARGYAEQSIHSLGHGVGVNIHERPFFGTDAETPLREGMVLTIEPGLYFPGHFGVRIEDMVLVTKKGPVTLTRSPRTITII